MKLTFGTNHISIRPFDPIDLPDLVVLTGRNGSGKTHLLQAINAGACRLDEFQHHEIQYFNYQNFLAQNAGGYNTTSIEQITTQGFSEFQVNFLPHIHNIFVELAKKWQPTKNYPDAVSFYQEVDDFWHATYRNRRYNEHLDTYRQEISKWLENPNNIARSGQYPAIWSVIQKSHVAPHLIERDSFGRLFVPILDAGSILGFSLSTLFTKYKISEFNWCHNEFSEGRTASVEKSRAIYRRQTPPPWLAINSLLKKMGSATGSRDTFRFEITSPDTNLIKIQDINNFTFLAQLRNISTNDLCNFDDLSSGEKVLLALACSIFYSDDMMMLPRVILLDEVDASLHPSMIRTLLDALRAAFVERGTKVMLATHSPTTVALTAPESLYFVEAGPKPKKVRKISKRDALTLLSEGYVTFDDGLKALKFSGERLVVFTEGYNRKILSKYLSILGIDGVKFVEGLDDSTGKEQLVHYFRAISALGLNRPFLFVWDCDGESETRNLKEDVNLYKFVIPKNMDNKFADRGIENAFSEELLEPFCLTTTRANGITNRRFDKDQKKSFLERIVKSKDLADFSGLKGFKEKVQAIIGS